MPSSASRSASARPAARERPLRRAGCPARRACRPATGSATSCPPRAASRSGSAGCRAPRAARRARAARRRSRPDRAAIPGGSRRRRRAHCPRARSGWRPSRPERSCPDARAAPWPTLPPDPGCCGPGPRAPGLAAASCTRRRPDASRHPRMAGTATTAPAWRPTRGSTRTRAPAWRCGAVRRSSATLPGPARVELPASADRWR